MRRISIFAQKKRVICAAVQAALLGPVGVPALAQNLIDEVVVTGSRVERTGFDTPTPVRVVSVEELFSADPASLGEALNMLPEFQNSPRPQTTGINTVGNAGQSFLNLRSIGAERTLILLDGRRVVPSTGNGTVDISVLPEALVERVDVVTGGASAAYGSDAVAGVVNFVLDSDFTGFKSSVQYGQSEESDSENMRLSLTGGVPLLNERAHLLGSINFNENKGVDSYGSRDWFDSCARIPNPDSVPANIVQCRVVPSTFARGGLITAGPLRGTQFGSGGTPEPFIYGDMANSMSMVGGSGEDHGAWYQPIPATERTNAFGRFSYDLTPTATIYIEGLAAEAEAKYNATGTWQGFGTAYTIYRDNAFLPAGTTAAMDEAGISDFSLSRYNHDFGPMFVTSRNRTQRWVLGLDAELGGWSLNAYIEHGSNKYKQTVANNLRVNRLYNAVDAVRNPLTGDIVCNSTLSFPGNGCVPLNLFGHGSPSQAALDWVQGTTLQETEVEQDVVEVSLSGEPFETWAGPVGVAFGAGYRKDSYEQRSDPVSQEAREFSGGYRGFARSYTDDSYVQIGGWERTNPLPARGSIDVHEVFAEFVMPLASGMPLAQALDLNGAARHTDYSTSGGVNTWKLGLTWRPIDELLVRASRSRDIRAANLEEAYRGGIQGLSTVTDASFEPTDPRYQPFVLGRDSGNPNLTPEEGNTTTLGLVYQPDWLPGLSMAVDWYDIELEDAIEVIGSQQMIDQCLGGAQQLCQYLFRDSDTGALTRVERPSLNIGRLDTNGVDIELRYLTSLGDGNLTFRAIANQIRELQVTSPGAPSMDYAGQLGGFDGVPDWTANLSVRYDLERLSLFLQGRYIDGGVIDNSLGPNELSSEDNSVPSVFFTDFTATWRFQHDNGEVELFGTVNNLLDRDPPSVPGNFFFFGTSPTSTAHYDIIGRRYTMGVRIRY